MRILGIETSCDETAAAVVSRDQRGKPMLCSNVVLSQIDEHSAFGGVVPEIAARAHLSAINRVIEMALKQAGTDIAEIDGVGVTSGPGLIGGLIVGLMTAKALSVSRGVPYLGINHLEGHALTARLTDGLDYPYLLLLVSGGHSQIVCVHGLGNYERWATTIDDAAGEVFDKTAKLLGLPFPGGPNVEKAASKGDLQRFNFPMPLKGKDTLNMSFSGLKTAIRQAAQKLSPLSEQDVADLCASLQKTMGDVLADRCAKSMKRFSGIHETNQVRSLVVAGGVASNSHIRERIKSVCEDAEWKFIAPAPVLCTDNAAMIGWAALERFERGETSPLDLSPRARWPLDADATNVIGSGRKGVKV